ncbi:MAG: FecCD family ABC transporter permease [Acidimicrobiia bacterium]
MTATATGTAPERTAPGEGTAGDDRRGRDRRIPAGVLLGGLAIAVVAVTVLNVSTGALHVNGLDVVRTIGDRLGLADATSVPRAARTVVWDVRLPRTLLAVTVGAGLGLAGASLQGIYRNPLADPGIIGVSAGAALGAVAAIVIGFGSLGSSSTPIAAFAGAITVSMLVYRLSRRGGRTEVVTLVLTGIALNAIVAATVGFLTTRADDQQLRSIVFWQLGSFAGARWRYVAVATAVVAVGLATLPALGRRLDLLALGEREARHLGVETERLRRLVIAVSALVVGGCVAVSGIVAFVGLVVPHLIRMAAGPRHRVLLPGAALGGATLLGLADLGARTVAQPQELPLGVVTSGVGGVFFLWLLLSVRRAQGGWA